MLFLDGMFRSLGFERGLDGDMDWIGSEMASVMDVARWR